MCFPTNLNCLLHYNAHGDGISFFEMLYCDDNDGVDDAIYCLTQMIGACVMTLAMDSGWVQFKVLPSDFVGVFLFVLFLWGDNITPVSYTHLTLPTKVNV